MTEKNTSKKTKEYGQVQLTVLVLLFLVPLVIGVVYNSTNSTTSDPNLEQEIMALTTTIDTTTATSSTTSSTTTTPQCPYTTDDLSNCWIECVDDDENCKADEELHCCFTRIQHPEYYCSVGICCESVPKSCPTTTTLSSTTTTTSTTAIPCLQHGQSAFDTNVNCCEDLQLKADLWNNETWEIFICCYPSECAQDGICVQDGSEYPEWNVKCENGEWVEITATTTTTSTTSTTTTTTQTTTTQPDCEWYVARFQIDNDPYGSGDENRQWTDDLTVDLGQRVNAGGIDTRDMSFKGILNITGPENFTSSNPDTITPTQLGNYTLTASYFDCIAHANLHVTNTTTTSTTTTTTTTTTSSTYTTSTTTTSTTIPSITSTTTTQPTTTTEPLTTTTQPENLNVQITSPDSITRGQEFSLETTIEANAITENVVLTWQLPEGFEIVFGSGTKGCGTLDVGSVCSSNITVQSSLSTGLGKNDIGVVVSYE